MIAAILFILLVVLVVLGVPVTIAMCASALAAILLSGLDPVIIPSIFSGGISNYTLIAVPFFILLGNIMNSGGITRRIFDFADALVGHLRGGLAQVNILSSLIFAGISGTSAADAAGLGLVEIDAMKKRGYDMPFTVGITLASSVLGPIIPPSVTFLIFASLTSVSPGKLFIAGILPGILIAAALMITCAFLCSKGKIQVPDPTPFSGRRLWKTFCQGFFALITPVLLVVVITSGIATATEAGIVGVVYALFVGLIYRELTWKVLWKAITDTVKSSALILFLIGCGSVIGWIISAQRIPQLLADAVLSLPVGRVVILCLINIFLLLLGCFMDGTSIQLIMVPILVPIAVALQVDLLTLGVIMTINIMIGTATPPVGLGLFIMSSISGLPLEKVIEGIKPFFPPLVAGLLAITYIPFFTTWLPGLMK
ncbi:MAG: TRAP transporter large permease [Ruminococcaceae bacterium]|nr:TRAP transporter large permease [Oscillospiraceae bacterium]